MVKHLVVLVSSLSAVLGCASEPLGMAPPTSTLVQAAPRPPAGATTFTYEVKPGDTVWRIAHDFGIEPQQLTSANGLSDVRDLKVGARLLIPVAPESSRFLWPVRGKTVRAKWPVRAPGAQGLDITTTTGAYVRASRSGQVAVATNKLLGWGNVIVLDHGDGYSSVYCHLRELLVRPGESVRQGNPLGRLGTSALYFEIRQGVRPLDPLSLLP